MGGSLDTTLCFLTYNFQGFQRILEHFLCNAWPQFLQTLAKLNMAWPKLRQWNLTGSFSSSLAFRDLMMLAWQLSPYRKIIIFYFREHTSMFILHFGVATCRTQSWEKLPTECMPLYFYWLLVFYQFQIQKIRHDRVQIGKGLI